jgi:COP9 signalosome complex subunit 1
VSCRATTEEHFVNENMELFDPDSQRVVLCAFALRQESYKSLGDLHYRNGDLQSALKAYVKLKETATTSQHTAEMCLLVVKTAIDLGHWRPASNHILKGEQTEYTLEFAAQMKAAGAIVALQERQYKHAARKFLSIDHDVGSSFADVATQEDVVVYGVLCALASLDRQELRRRVRGCHHHIANSGDI